MIFNELSDNQRRIFIDAVQLYEAFMAALPQKPGISRGNALEKSQREGIFI